MVEQVGGKELTRLVDRLREDLGDALQVVGVGWDADDVDILHLREDLDDRFGRETIEDMGIDLLADRHLEVGNLSRHGLEGPTITGRFYDQSLLVVCWDEALPVGVMVEPDADHFPPTATALQDALERVT